MVARTRTDLTMPVALAAALPIIFFRLGTGFVRFKAKRRSAVRAFRRELVRGGMGPDAAERFAAEFASYGRLRTHLKGAIGRFFPFPR